VLACQDSLILGNKLRLELGGVAMVKPIAIVKYLWLVPKLVGNALKGSVCGSGNGSGNELFDILLCNCSYDLLVTCNY
jgi:hypothetical protein